MLDLYIPKTRKNTKSSGRNERVAELVREFLGQFFIRGDLPVPLKKGMNTPLITVTHVQLSPDLKHATVLVMPMHGQNKEQSTGYLNRVAPYIRSKLAQSLSLRFTPHLRFKIDPTFDSSKVIDDVFARIHTNENHAEEQL